MQADGIRIASEGGNPHVLEGPGVAVFRKGQDYYVQIDIPTHMKHPEHRTITIEPGRYVIDSVRRRDVATALFARPATIPTVNPD